MKKRAASVNIGGLAFRGMISNALLPTPGKNAKRNKKGGPQAAFRGVASLSAT